MPLIYTKNNAGEFVCPHCGVTKTRQNTMYYHMRKHETELPHKCTSCPMQFIQRQSLELHIQAKHSASVQIIAPPKTLREALQARTEVAAITARPIFKCPSECCSFSALSKGNCRIHYFRVHYATDSNSYFDKSKTSCTLCLSEFSSSTHFYYHIGPCMKTNATIILEKEVLDKLL